MYVLGVSKYGVCLVQKIPTGRYLKMDGFKWALLCHKREWKLRQLNVRGLQHRYVLPGLWLVPSERSLIANMINSCILSRRSWQERRLSLYSTPKQIASAFSDFHTQPFSASTSNSMVSDLKRTWLPCNFNLWKIRAWMAGKTIGANISFSWQLTHRPYLNWIAGFASDGDNFAGTVNLLSSRGIMSSKLWSKACKVSKSATPS